MPQTDLIRRARSESGNILVLTALSLVVLLGITALAIDGSYGYSERNRMAAAADAASKSAAYQLKYGYGDLQAYANREVVMHGFTPGSDVTVTVNTPPSYLVTSPFYNQPGFVEVVVSGTRQTFFGNILGFANLTPLARSVAGTAQPSSCLIAMDDLTFGNTTFTMNGCGASVGGDLSGTNPNAEVTGTPVPPVSVTGTCSGYCSSMGVLATSQPAPIDPFAGLPSPTVAGTCGPATINPLPPGCYTTIPGTITNFTGGGIYKVTGLIDITSSLAGSNMLLYLTSTASINGGNNGTLTISAGNTAPYAGIAIYGDAGSQINAGNAFELNITGALYMPDSDLTFNNHLQIDNTNCTLIIVNSLDIDNGNSQILNTSGCAGSFSNAAFLGVAISE